MVLEVAQASLTWRLKRGLLTVAFIVLCSVAVSVMAVIKKRREAEAAYPGGRARLSAGA